MGRRTAWGVYKWKSHWRSSVNAAVLQGDPPLDYDWHDERVGTCTRVDFGSDQITFSLGRNHYSGAILGAGMFAAFFALMLCVPFGNRTWFWGFFLMCFPFCLFNRFQSIKRHYGQFPIVLQNNDHASNDDSSIHYSDVKFVIARENTGRRSHDDTELAQVYLLRSSTDQPLLVHQHYLRNRSSVIQVAERLASELGVDLKLEFDTTEPGDAG